jgi:hypothetical protein
MGAKQAVKPARPARAGRNATGTSSPPGPVTTPDQGAPVPAGGGPAPAAARVSGSAASPPAVMEMPLQLVTVQAGTSPYVTVGSQDLVPIYTSDGAAIPATAPGRWAQLRAAGRP